MIELERLTLEDFQPLVGQRFSVVYPERTEILTLVEAKATRTQAPAGWRQGFSLEFKGSSTDGYLPQKVHPLTHETMGQLELFLVPLGPGPQGGACCYEAVFS